jgi:RNA polymerase sigma factor (sigma-70 family)
MRSIGHAARAESEPNRGAAPPIGMEATLDVITTDQPTPTELVETARAGDRSAFGRLVEPWLAPALGASIIITRSHADGADAVQDALLTAWQGLDALRDPTAFPAWFRTLVIRSALRVARRRGVVVPLELVVDKGGPADGGLDGSLDQRLLGRAFDRLDTDDRALLTLRYLWDLPVADTALALDTLPGTIKSRTHAALGRLRAAFDAEARR